MSSFLVVIYFIQMKLFYLFIFSTLFFSAQTVFADCTIITTLRVGSTGEQVRCLQVAVGANADGRFGPLTKASVVFFQSNNRLSPDGVVGPLTRVVLNRVVTGSADSALLTTNDNNNTKPSGGIKNNVENINPNLKNLDIYIAAVKRGALKGGLSSDKLPLLEDKIRKQAETSSDFHQQFLNIQKAIHDKEVSKKTFKAFMLAFFEKAINKTFVIKKVWASGGLSFGGYVSYMNPQTCDCPPGIFTQLFVASPIMSPPLSNLLLDYKNGSQKFLAYNLPEPDVGILGLYEPGVPSCWTYVGESCVLIKSDGLITPFVGSSLEPAP